MSLINSLKGRDWQTPECSSYFCRISKREVKGKAIQFTLIPGFSARSLCILHVINSSLIPTMFCYLDVALFLKKMPSFSFIPVFHFLHHQVFRKPGLTFCWTPANTHISSITRRMSIHSISPFSSPITDGQFTVCSPKISHQEKLRFTPKILTHFPGNRYPETPLHSALLLN